MRSAATDRRIIIKDPSMLGLREQVVDFPYDMMISSVKLYKGVFSSNDIFTSAGLRNSGRRGMIEKLVGTEYNVGEEAAVITTIPKDKAANHWWSDRILSLSLNLVIYRT